MISARKIWLGTALLSAFAVAAFVGGAAAQLAGETIRIGIILPEVDPEAAEGWQSELADEIEHGAILGQEEHTFNAQMLGADFNVLFETASGAEAAVAAADRLLAEGVYGIAGGYSIEEAVALGQWAEEHGVPFLNIGVQSDLIRNDQCYATTFHVEASAAMYLDAMAGWYVPDGNRRWFIVRSDDEESERLLERLEWTLSERHFAVDEVGTVVLSGDIAGSTLVEAFDRSGADLMVLLISPAEQLEILAELNDAGFTGNVTGYPHPETQTREYLLALAETAPDISHYRIQLWEPTLDTSGSIEFNARYRNRWDGETMGGPAWASYHAVKILFDSAFFSNSTVSEVVLNYLNSPSSVFDLHKLLGGSFRPWDRQLRQPVYLVQLNHGAESVFRLGLLVGELPALYMPGTDPVERLDQIGDLAGNSTCGR